MKNLSAAYAMKNRPRMKKMSGGGEVQKKKKEDVDYAENLQNYAKKDVKGTGHKFNYPGQTAANYADGGEVGYCEKCGSFLDESDDFLSQDMDEDEYKRA